MIKSTGNFVLVVRIVVTFYVALIVVELLRIAVYRILLQSCADRLRIERGGEQVCGHRASHRRWDLVKREDRPSRRGLRGWSANSGE